jgi:hypothetical protein
MATDTSAFVEERSPKIFQCNFTHPPIPATLDVLSVAASGLSEVMNKFTGQPVWRIQPKPQRIANETDGYSVLAASTYPVAGMTGSVTLGLNAIGQGAVGTRLVVVFQDSMAWDIPTAENDADAAMQAMALFLNRMPNDGWRMLQGRWRYPHKFDVPGIIGNDPQGSAAEDQDNVDLPEGLLDSPTDRAFRNLLPGVEPRVVLDLLGTALRNNWHIEKSTFGADQTLLARNRAWPGQVLGIAASCSPVDGGELLTIRFGDKGRWSAAEALQALEDSINAVTGALRSRFADLSLAPWTIPGSNA